MVCSDDVKTLKRVLGLSKFICGLSKPFMAELIGKIAIFWLQKDDEEDVFELRKLCICLISLSVGKAEKPCR